MSTSGTCTTTGEQSLVIDGQADSVHAVVFFPNGSRLASGGEGGAQVEVAADCLGATRAAGQRHR